MANSTAKARPEVTEGEIGCRRLRELVLVVIAEIMRIEDDGHAVLLNEADGILEPLQLPVVEGLTQHRLQPLPAEGQADDVHALAGEISHRVFRRVGVVGAEYAGAVAIFGAGKIDAAIAELGCGKAGIGLCVKASRTVAASDRRSSLVTSPVIASSCSSSPPVSPLHRELPR